MTEENIKKIKQIMEEERQAYLRSQRRPTAQKDDDDETKAVKGLIQCIDCLASAISYIQNGEYAREIDEDYNSAEKLFDLAQRDIEAVEFLLDDEMGGHLQNLVDINEHERAEEEGFVPDRYDMWRVGQ